MKGKWFQTFDSGGGALPEIAKRVCASQRGNDFEVPDLEPGYTYFSLHESFKLLAAIKRKIIKKANCCVARRRPW